MNSRNGLSKVPRLFLETSCLSLILLLVGGCASRSLRTQAHWQGEKELGLNSEVKSAGRWRDSTARSDEILEEVSWHFSPTLSLVPKVLSRPDSTAFGIDSLRSLAKSTEEIALATPFCEALLEASTSRALAGRVSILRKRYTRHNSNEGVVQQTDGTTRFRHTQLGYIEEKENGKKKYSVVGHAPWLLGLFLGLFSVFTVRRVYTLFRRKLRL